MVETTLSFQCHKMSNYICLFYSLYFSVCSPWGHGHFVLICVSLLVLEGT